MPDALPDRAPSLLLRGVRRVPVGRGPAPGPDLAEPVDVRVRGDVVEAVGPSLAAEPGEQVLEADGRWLVPGLWDAHVHLQQWARTLDRLDVSGTTGPEEVVAVVAVALADRLRREQPGGLVGFGYRSATWGRLPTVEELDAVTGDRPVVLISGDAHNGWLNSAALRALGMGPRTDPVEEAEWFALLARLDEAGLEQDPGGALRRAVEDAASRGVVGLVDMDLDAGPAVWPARVAAGVDLLRVRAATYAPGLDDVLAAGLRTGDALPGTRGLATMGPLKVIFDGSVNTRTAFCHDPYPGPPHHRDGWRGVLNHSPEELVGLCDRARRHGLEPALHAIGDAAVALALDALEWSGSRGSVEHVQMVAPADLPRFAALGVRASVQPAHLLDDRDVTVELWADRQDRHFALRSLLTAGADLRLGSDAPVARLDPWLAMAAAVHRSGDARPPWQPQESLTPAQALAASTDGQGTVQEGSRGDLALLDADPLAPQDSPRQAAAHLRTTRVSATVVAGRVTHSRL